MNHVVPLPDPGRLPVLARLHHLPTAAGMTIPFVTRTHRDPHHPVWGAVDSVRHRAAFERGLCQVCGLPLEHRVVVFARPDDWLRGVALEPGLHPECAWYSSRVCPMLATRLYRYRSNASTAHYRHCDDPACHCRLWKPPDRDPRQASREGRPADAWYALWIARDHYTVVRHPGDERTPPHIGILLEGVPVLAVRKIRDATEPTDRTVLDALAAQMAMTRLLTRE
ncbi:hypothetical protein [Nocardia terpenica]|uniref:Cell envelope biogenesis protein OmpA n=1 Tax=Nocardia terpenica TaxID=455432 RepID=A0A164IWX1_9NOCA|nr:hypothetical protein [Nocardia terpenica]KZM69819.1 hypothetical protein AWN90_04175 [Nocardia terpenica]NQE91167.1 hypothetical protein [Nocardia terpenica]